MYICAYMCMYTWGFHKKKAGIFYLNIYWIS